MTSSPPVTVLMSVKDAMPHLPLAISSILEQTFKDFQFIIVNDHSQDGTTDYLASIQDPRLQILNATSYGQTAGLNEGLQHAKGKWIVRMDGDDWSHPERIEAQLQSAAQHPEAILISADYWICDENLTVIAPIALNPHTQGFRQYLFNKQNPFCHSVMTFDREAVVKLGGYDLSHETAQDYPLWRALLSRGSLTHVARPLLKYRVQKSAVSIARYHEQDNSRRRLTHKDTDPIHMTQTSPDGLYAYRLGFAAWVGGKNWLCMAYMLKALRTLTHPPRSLALILLSLLPRRAYLAITGYSDVYR